MVNEISLSQLLSVHVGRLKDAGGLDPATVSMFKMNNVAKARQHRRAGAGRPGG